MSATLEDGGVLRCGDEAGVWTGLMGAGKAAAESWSCFLASLRRNWIHSSEKLCCSVAFELVLLLLLAVDDLVNKGKGAAEPKRPPKRPCDAVLALI